LRLRLFDYGFHNGSISFYFGWIFVSHLAIPSFVSISRQVEVIERHADVITSQTSKQCNITARQIHPEVVLSTKSFRHAGYVVVTKEARTRSSKLVPFDTPPLLSLGFQSRPLFFPRYMFCTIFLIFLDFLSLLCVVFRLCGGDVRVDNNVEGRVDQLWMVGLQMGLSLRSVNSNHQDATFNLGSTEGMRRWVMEWLAASGEAFPCYLFSLSACFPFLSACVSLYIMKWQNGQGEEARGRGEIFARNIRLARRTFSRRACAHLLDG